MFDINFEREKGISLAWKANFTVSEGAEVTIFIFHEASEKRGGWEVFLDMRSPNCDNDYSYETSLSSSGQRSTIADGFEYNSVKVTSKELDTVVKRVLEVVGKTQPNGCAAEHFYGS